MPPCTGKVTFYHVNFESLYMKRLIESLITWCKDNHLRLNTKNKIKILRLIKYECCCEEAQL